YKLKKLFSFIAIIGIILASNCTKIPVNNDPVIGIWTDMKVQTTDLAQKQAITMEWTFNDAYLGRFHQIEDGAIIIKSDFQWKQEDGKYTVSYPGLDRPEDTVLIISSDNGERLQRIDGATMAIRN